MKIRLIALSVVLGVLLTCTACRVRVDLSGDTLIGEETPTTTTTAPLPENNDEMAAEAWQIYSRALELEAEYTTYELNYSSRSTAYGELRVAKARIVRVEEEGEVSLLVESESGEEVSSGYFAGGIGYFFLDGEKYWMPTDEETFFDTLGFSPSVPPTEEMFSAAIAVQNADGGATVSCPLGEAYATDFAQMYLGSVARNGTVTHAELGVTVDAEGQPLLFVAKAEVYHSLYGTITVESENRYTAVGDAVVLTPPDDLETYSSIIE